MGPLYDLRNMLMPPDLQFNSALLIPVDGVNTTTVAAGNSSASRPTATGGAVAALSSGDFATAQEKLNFFLFRLDHKPGQYYFCMMKSAITLRHCLVELNASMQLFVTVNDDLPRVSAFPRAGFNVHDIMQKFLETMSGKAPPSPWELANVSTAISRPAENVYGIEPGVSRKKRPAFDEAWKQAQSRLYRAANVTKSSANSSTNVSATA